MKRIELAIFDLDNTLYDWYSAFLPAFYGMVDTTVEILHCDRGQLLDELRAVHIRHRDVEHPFSLVETPLVRSKIAEFGRDRVWEVLNPAFYAFNKIRKQRLSLFPDTLKTLEELRRQQIRLVAFTDSKYYAAVGRADRLGLADYFTNIYCRKRSTSERPPSSIDDGYDKFADKVKELPPDETKPDPQVLTDIALRETVSLDATAYIGDSVAKDVLMAKRAGCFAVWAKFGAQVDPTAYEQLIRISHWTEADIARERQYAGEAAGILPDFTCESSLAELLTAVTGPLARRAAI